MFPTPQDSAVHRRARIRQEKEDLKLIERASEITNPDELVDVILEISTMRYRQGLRKIKSTIGVPPENFAQWAESVGISNSDLEQVHRKQVQQAVIDRARQKLRQLKLEGEVGPNVYWVLANGSASKQRLNFVVVVTVAVR